MFEFDYEKESEKMKDTKIDADGLTCEYIRKISSCNLESLRALNIIYIYNKLIVIANMTPKNRATFEDERREKVIQGTNLIKRKLKEYYSYDIKTEEELKKIVERIKLIEESRIDSAYNMIQAYKGELKKLYEDGIGVVRTVLATNNLKSIIQTKSRENHYLNEIIDGVFATCDYNNLMNYVARVHSNGMIIRNNQIILYSNPFNLETSSPNIIKLIKPVSIYEMDIKDFEPVVDFCLDASNKPTIKFDNEWVARKVKVRCKEFTTDYLPKEFILNKNIIIRTNSSDININEIIN